MARCMVLRFNENNTLYVCVCIKCDLTLLLIQKSPYSVTMNTLDNLMGRFLGLDEIHCVKSVQTRRFFWSVFAYFLHSDWLDLSLTHFSPGSHFYTS